MTNAPDTSRPFYFPEENTLAQIISDAPHAEILKALREPFPPELVYERKGPGGKMLSYVSIETVLARLLDVAPGYSWVAAEPQIFPKVAAVGVVDGWSVVVSGQLTVGDKTAAGVGSMYHADLDMAVKSANSEAMKNAAKNGFGVMLELWDKTYLASLEARKRIGKMTVAALKNDVFKIAREALDKDKPTAKEIAGYFAVDPGSLTDADTLRGILLDRL